MISIIYGIFSTRLKPITTHLPGCTSIYHNNHYCDVIMGAVASQITSFTIVHSTVYSDTKQRKHQSSASLAFVRGIHRGPVNSSHKCHYRGKCFHFMTSSWQIDNHIITAQKGPASGRCWPRSGPISGALVWQAAPQNLKNKNTMTSLYYIPCPMK